MRTRSVLGRIVSDGHRAAAIITGIRAMFRKESTERSPVAINEVICDVVATSLGDLKSRRVSLTLELVDDPAPIPADRVQLQQVLANLVTNAINSMAAVNDRSHTLVVRSERLDEWVLVSVQDTGTGIAPEAAERLFEAFYTTKAKRHRIGLVDQPLDRRGARRPAVGLADQPAWNGVSDDVAGRPVIAGTRRRGDRQRPAKLTVSPSRRSSARPDRPSPGRRRGRAGAVP